MVNNSKKFVEIILKPIKIGQVICVVCNRYLYRTNVTMKG